MLGFLFGLAAIASLVTLAGGGKKSDADVGDDGNPLPRPPVPTPDPVGVDFPEPDPVTEPELEPLVNVLEATEPDDFAEVRDVLEQRNGQPSTVYLGWSPDWAGLAETEAALRELAAEAPEVRVLLVSFERTQRLFGLPDSYLSFAVTATNPDGRPFVEVFTGDRRSDGPVGLGTLSRLLRYAAEGTPESTPTQAPGFFSP